MSRGLFTTPEERDALAGEYVFGTLDAATAARVTAALTSDSGLREAVAEWEARLAPLSPDPPDRHPHPGWDRMENGRPAIIMRPARRARRDGRRFWRLWALAASVAAVALGIALLLPGATETTSQAVLLPDGAAAAWLARVDRDGTLHLARIAPSEAAPSPDATAKPAIDDRVLQAWVRLAGGAVTAIGVLPRGAARATIARLPVTLAPGMLIELSLEPPGGAPSGQPTGPVVFIGRLTGAGGG
jgi:anti-sigma-K factor RskA